MPTGPIASCPDTFTVCGPPQHSLGIWLMAVPLVGAVLALIGGALLLRLVRLRGTEQRWPIPLLVVLFGSFLSAAAHDRIVPPGPVVFYDEFLHAETTTNLATRMSPHPCCGYENDACLPGGPIEWPLSTHLASAGLMRITGGSDVRDGMKSRQQLNRLASLVSPMLAFAWVLLLVPDALAAMLVALALALWPGVIRLMSTADLAPGAVFFMLLALIAVELERRRPSWPSMLLVVGSMALAFHARLEIALILPWILWRSPRRWSVFAAAAVIVAPMVWLYLDGRNTTIGWSPDLLSQLKHHLPVDLMFLVSPMGGVPALILFALVGLTRRELIPLFATAIGMLLFVASYTFGEFRTDADGFRYAILLIVLLLPLAAAGVEAITRRAVAPRGLTIAMLAIATLAPMATQRGVLTMTNPVAQLDELVLGHRLQASTVVTRSVAYARARTEAPTIVERCSMDRVDLRASEGDGLYLRTWGDKGPEARRCEWQSAAVAPSPDGLGKWLFVRENCFEDE